jgi:hypothetical protein
MCFTQRIAGWRASATAGPVIADAVAASVAVALAFGPVVLQTYPGGCARQGPLWTPGRSQPACGPAQSRERISKPSVQLVKFLAAGRTEVAKQIESAIIRHVTELDESLGWFYVRVQDRPSYAFCAGHHRRGR